MGIQFLTSNGAVVLFAAMTIVYFSGGIPTVEGAWCAFYANTETKQGTFTDQFDFRDARYKCRDFCEKFAKVGDYPCQWGLEGHTCVLKRLEGEKYVLNGICPDLNGIPCELTSDFGPSMPAADKQGNGWCAFYVNAATKQAVYTSDFDFMDVRYKCRGFCSALNNAGEHPCIWAADHNCVLKGLADGNKEFLGVCPDLNGNAYEMVVKADGSRTDGRLTLMSPNL